MGVGGWKLLWGRFLRESTTWSKQEQQRACKKEFLNPSNRPHVGLCASGNSSEEQNTPENEETQNHSGGNNDLSEAKWGI
jgi:hypothetical protein